MFVKEISYANGVRELLMSAMMAVFDLVNRRQGHGVTEEQLLAVYQHRCNEPHFRYSRRMAAESNEEAAGLL